MRPSLGADPARLPEWAGIVAAYAAFASLWILVSDQALEMLVPGREDFTLVSTLKGWLFVIVTSVLLWALIGRYARRADVLRAREAAAEAERAHLLRLLDAIARSSTDAIFAKDGEGRYLLFNPAAARFTGKSEADVLGRDDYALFPPEQAALIQANDRRVMSENRVITSREDLATSEGLVSFLATKGPICDSAGHVVGSFGISRNITGIVAAERALRVRSACNRLVVRASDEAQLLAEVCRLLVEQGGYVMAWVGLTGEAPPWPVVPVASAGANRDYLDALHIALDDPRTGRGPTARAIRDGRPTVANDLATDPAYGPWREAAGQRGFRASIALPLGVDGATPRGALNLYSATARAFDEPEVELLAGLAEDLAHGLRSLRDRAERERTRRELETTATALGDLLEASPVVVYAVPVDGSGGRVSANIERLLGYRVEEALAAGWWAAGLHPDDRAAALTAAATLAERGELVHDYRFAHRDGHYLWIHDQLRLVRDATGRPTEIVGAWTNVTELKATQTALETERRLLAESQQLAHIGSWMLDLVNDRITWTDETYRIFGLGRDGFEHNMTAFQARLHPEDSPLMQDWMEALVARREPGEIEFRIVRPDGAVRWVRGGGRLRCDDQGQPRDASGCVQDITERKTTELALQASEARYRDMFAANPNPMWVYDMETLAFLQVNDAAVHQYGYSRAEFLAMTIRDIRPAEDVPRLEEKARQAHTSFGEGNYWRHRRKDGSLITVDIASHVLEHAGRRAKLVLALDVTERLQSEAALRAGERHFRALFEQAAVGMAEVAPDGRWLRVNQRLCEIVGYGRDELTGLTFQDITHPDDLASDLHEVRRLLAGEAATYQMEKRYRRKDGRIIWILLTVALVRDAAGAPDYFISVVEDIDARKAAEQLLRESELRFRLAAAHGQVWDWNIVSGRANFGEQFFDLLGLARDEVGDPAERLAERMHPGDRPRWRQALRDHLARRTPYAIEFRARHRNGEWLWFSTQGQAVWDSDGRATYMAGTTFEITARKRAEAALAQSERKLRLFFDLPFIGMAVTSPRTKRWIDANQTLCDILGYPREELVEKTWAELTHPDDLDADVAQFERVMSGAADGYEMEKRFLRADGRVVRAKIDVKCVRDAQGAVDFFVATIDDVTERWLAEQRLREYAQRLRGLSRRLLTVQEEERRALARELHDEFGQSLAALKINLHTARRQIGDDADGMTRLAECIAIADTVIAQVRDRALDLRPAILDDLGLGPALEWFTGRQRALGGCEYSLRMAGVPAQLPPEIEITVFRIVQEAANNARRHGGATHVNITLAGQPGRLDVAIEDDGRGFDPALERRPGATGIGLPGMQERVELLQGRFVIDSRPGAGCRVRAELPLPGAAAAASEHP